jgi:hypothetical protein
MRVDNRCDGVRGIVETVDEFEAESEAQRKNQEDDLQRSE